MRIFLKRNILFFLPVLLCAIFLEFLLRSIPNDYSYKKSYLDNHSNNINILVLGSSHSYYGINPIHFTDYAFNASHVSQFIDMDYNILKKYSNRFDRLHFIVMPISYFSLFGRISEDVECWRIKNYNIYYKLYLSFKLKTYSELLTFSFRKNMYRIFDFYIKDVDNITSSELGYYNKIRKQRDLIKTGLDAAKWHTISDKKYLHESVDILYKLSDYAEIRGIRILFYTSPACSSYVENLDDTQLNLTTETMKSLCNNYANCFYFNYLTDNRFLAEDFSDADHLNTQGATKLSKIINSEIERIKTLKPQSLLLTNRQ